MSPTSRKPPAPIGKDTPLKRSASKKATASSTARSRGPLMSMRSTETFRAFVIEQLAGVRDVHARAMFGGVGLYAGDVFFGIIAADMLYLKVNDTNRAAYERAGSEPFRPYADRAMAMPYYNVPLSVLEDGDTLAEWARQAVAVARANKSGKKR